MNVLHDPRWVDASRTFSRDLLLSILRTDACKVDVVTLLSHVLRHTLIRNEVIELLRYITKSEEAKQITELFFDRVFRGEFF